MLSFTVVFLNIRSRFADKSLIIVIFRIIISISLSIDNLNISLLYNLFISSNLTNTRVIIITKNAKAPLVNVIIKIIIVSIIYITI